MSAMTPTMGATGGTIVEVPERRFLSVQGQSSPYAPPFQGAIRALYAVAAELGPRSMLAPLEALWWWGHGPGFPRDRTREWRWRLLLPVQDDISDARIDRARAQAIVHHPELAVGLVEPWRFAEGRCMQVLHVGAYREESGAFERLAREVAEAGLEPTGLHHEIYLSDPRRAQPDLLRTLLRQPVRRRP